MRYAFFIQIPNWIFLEELIQPPQFEPIYGCVKCMHAMSQLFVRKTTDRIKYA